MPFSSASMLFEPPCIDIFRENCSILQFFRYWISYALPVSQNCYIIRCYQRLDEPFIFWSNSLALEGMFPIILPFSILSCSSGLWLPHAFYIENHLLKLHGNVRSFPYYTQYNNCMGYVICINYIRVCLKIVSTYIYLVESVGSFALPLSLAFSRASFSCSRFLFLSAYICLSSPSPATHFQIRPSCAASTT